MSKYFLTTYTIRVLSEDNHVEDATPAELAELIDTGPCVGLICPSSKEITAERTAELLKEYGSEPGFFQLDDEGNEV